MTAQLPVIQTDTPHALPPMYAYRIGQGMVASLPMNPDHAPPRVVALPTPTGARRTVNGLTARADAMARWVAHGATLTDAMRMAYRSTATGLALTRSAARVARNPKWRSAVDQYAAKMAEERKQASIPVHDFVMLRLAHEAQTAKTDAARVASLRLLGMTEGMFTTVHKRETTLDPKQLDQLKAKLDQRLRDTLARLGNGVVPVRGTEPAAIEGEILPGEGYTPPDPLVATQEDPHEPNTMALERVPLSPGPIHPLSPDPPTPLAKQAPLPSAEGPAPSQAGGSPPEDPAAGYLDELSGPLILSGGWRRR